MAIHSQEALELERLAIAPLYARPRIGHGIPKDQLPDDGMDPRVAYRLIHDELMLDGNSRQNLATFVTTYMDEEADRLFAETLDKNMIDKDEYPQTAAIEGRCVRMIAQLWNAPEGANATGTSTTGSSEAVMLGGLALKWRWRQRREAAGLPTDRPNLVMGINVQVVWEKFCRYWDVEPRYAPVEEGRLQLNAEEALRLCDENTIGVVAILGSTFDGSYEPVKEIAEALDALAASGGPDIPVHVDAASGGFVAPFIDPDLEWDFRVPRVRSINSSGHKYGLVYPGVGWVIWRTPEDLPGDLVFHVNYLGGDMPTFALNFSRPGAQVIAQYYNLIRLGREGYREIQQACRDTAMYLSSQIAAIGPYELLSDGSELPVFMFRLKPEVTNYTVYDVSAKLRERGWQVPAYSLPDNLTSVSGLRVVVRNGFGRDLANLFLDDLRRTTEFLESLPARMPHDPAHTESFSH
jgi:glutamate decarboxylase